MAGTLGRAWEVASKLDELAAVGWQRDLDAAAALTAPTTGGPIFVRCLSVDEGHRCRLEAGHRDDEHVCWGVDGRGRMRYYRWTSRRAAVRG